MTNEITLDYKPQSRSDVLLRELDDGCVLYEPKLENIHSMNSTAAYIWTLCDSDHSVEDIIEMVKYDYREFTAEPEIEVKQIIQRFHDLGLLQTTS